MNSRGQFFAMLAVAGALVAGFVTLYRLRLGRGDFFPAYSSLRSDPLGTRVLYESLASMPAQQVTRWLQSLDQLPATPQRTLILAGLTTDRWKQITKEELAAIEAAARGGSRVVIALVAETEPEEKPRQKSEERRAKKREDDRAAKSKKTPPADSPGDRRDEGEKKPAFVDLAKEWGVTIKRLPAFGAARRAPLAPVELPREVRWETETFFETPEGSPWRAMYRRSLHPVVIERALGLGSVVLASDAFFLSNEALQRNRQTSLLTWATGAFSTVEFVESHLGIVREPGVAALARRYGLGGAFFTFLVLAALFAWQRMAGFVPPAEPASGVMLEYNQTAGLEALLRRAVAPADLVKACATEWRGSARPLDIARVNAVLAENPKATPPATLYNKVVRALRHR
ncbi:MAG: DUF4350 domain-containing protein [Opitutaceae bacterium]